ncbi:hypothetical protein BDK51DRAFT_25820 [Blyttiomyces helicus]|uniref:Uncharacterized protein n=1 Tax=Blyttiomyces helicus TaxID=388810 RepID=A0A4V1ISK1_9FUNG|nr:hypothetical protein BDK51DRAFT_25820 [Blyttiomyces helicus]|eukprot:RKO93837.1 hypothetical protein BDK51DRAFT_25820 [Blyttiomyces helicus]
MYLVVGAPGLMSSDHSMRTLSGGGQVTGPEQSGEPRVKMEVRIGNGGFQERSGRRVVSSDHSVQSVMLLECLLYQTRKGDPKIADECGLRDLGVAENDSETRLPEQLKPQKDPREIEITYLVLDLDGLRSNQGIAAVAVAGNLFVTSSRAGRLLGPGVLGQCSLNGGTKGSG